MFRYNPKHSTQNKPMQDLKSHVQALKTSSIEAQMIFIS